MKKLFYIVLLGITILLVCAYIKGTAPQHHTSTETITSADNCICNSECLCQENEIDCSCAQTKTTCSCTQKDGKTVTVESIDKNNENIEESNPEQTSSEDETIL